MCAARSLLLRLHVFLVFFFNDTATTEIYTLSLHDALPTNDAVMEAVFGTNGLSRTVRPPQLVVRSEEHTSELQSQSKLVFRPLLEKKKKQLTHRSDAPIPRNPPFPKPTEYDVPPYQPLQ